MNKEIKTGRIIPNGVSLEKHENDTIIFFTNLGIDIELIKPSNTPHNKNADFIMNGKIWAMKSPQGKSYKTIEHLFEKASKQSQNIVFDLHRSKLDEEKVTNILTRFFNQSKQVKNMLIITKNNDLLTFTK